MLADVALTLKITKTAEAESVNVTVIVEVEPLSSATKIELNTAVVAAGVVYNVVTSVVVKSTFAFL